MSDLTLRDREEVERERQTDRQTDRQTEKKIEGDRTAGARDIARAIKRFPFIAWV